MQPVLREVPAPPWKLLWRKSFPALFHVLSVNLRARAVQCCRLPILRGRWCPFLLLQGMLGPALPRCEMGESLSFFGEMGQN